MKSIVTLLLISIQIQCLVGYCKVPKTCKTRNMIEKTVGTYQSFLICSIKQQSQLDFDTNETDCKQREESVILFKPDKSESNSILGPKSIDLPSLIRYLNLFQSPISLQFESFKGFELFLFDSNISLTANFTQLELVICTECEFNFYLGEKQMRSCDDYENFHPRSIFQFFSDYFQDVYLFLSEPKNKICPLAFKSVDSLLYYIIGYNSYFSRRLIEFSNETFADLNSTIIQLEIRIENVEIDFRLIHPSVFQETKFIYVLNQVKSIHTDFFLNLTNVKNILFDSTYFRSLIHRQGIEWIRNINKNLDVNISDWNELKMHIKQAFFMIIDFQNNVRSDSG